MLGSIHGWMGICVCLDHIPLVGNFEAGGAFIHNDLCTQSSTRAVRNFLDEKRIYRVRRNRKNLLSSKLERWKTSPWHYSISMMKSFREEYLNLLYIDNLLDPNDVKRIRELLNWGWTNALIMQTHHMRWCAFPGRWARYWNGDSKN